MFQVQFKEILKVKIIITQNEFKYIIEQYNKLFISKVMIK